MKKILSVFLIALLALTVLGVTGVLLFRYFVADRIMDNGGTMNTDYMDGSETPFILDGDHTYVDNEKLLQVITGTWASEDGHYVIKLNSDCRIIEYALAVRFDEEQIAVRSGVVNAKGCDLNITDQKRFPRRESLDAFHALAECIIFLTAVPSRY